MPHLLTAGIRPASIWYDGLEVRIDLRDRWHCLTCRHYLSIMQRTHPDRPASRTGSLFRLASKALRNYRKRELKWYARRGLNLPRVSLKELPHG